MTHALAFVAGATLILVCASAVLAQQTNPVDRKVENPVTDTPYVNPLQQDQPVRPPAIKIPAIQAGDKLDVTCARQSVTGTKEARVEVCEGAVDARIGTFRLQADKITTFDAKNLIVADGNVV